MPRATCATSGCGVEAAYATRSKPAWCERHLRAIQAAGGLEPLEAFVKPTAWQLCRCLVCGCEAHYRFEMTLERNERQERSCRACYWREWAAETRRLQGSFADLGVVNQDAAREVAVANGFEYLGPLTSPSIGSDPHLTRCIYCGNRQAQRLADVAFGCHCQRNPKRFERGPAPVKTLLRDHGGRAVAMWDHDRNSPDVWATATVRATRVVWWKCPTCSHQFEGKVVDIVGGAPCAPCWQRREAEYEAKIHRYRSTPVASVPSLIEAWDDPADPATVMVAEASDSRRQFRCARGHRATQFPLRYLDAGCPTCRGQETRRTNLAAVEEGHRFEGLSPELASQWHPTANGRIQQAKVGARSRRTIWWRDPACGHEWSATPADREKNQRLRCPICRTVLDSLAQQLPHLALQWHPKNPLSPWHVRASGSLPFLPRWICADDPSHEWEATTTARASGASCPQCRVVGKSAVELAHLAAAVKRFGAAASGPPMRSAAFTHRSVWHPDIVVDLPGQRLAIEYVGSYWHAGKRDVDTAKTVDLLAAGLLVARIREHPLEGLGISHASYLEVTSHATVPDPAGTIGSIALWATSVSTAQGQG